MITLLARSVTFPGYDGYMSMWEELKNFADNRAMGISAKGLSLPDSKIASQSQGAGRNVADPLKVTIAIAARMRASAASSCKEHMSSSSRVGVVILTIDNAELTFSFITAAFLPSPARIVTLFSQM
eukprot:3508184-Ditylum_brightwellii.AAC.1